jgi:hypothetical protein
LFNFYVCYCFLPSGRLGIKGIESGSKLLSAADIEKAIRASPDILDCYVVGLGDTDVSSDPSHLASDLL